jgi:hypothetical protein
MPNKPDMPPWMTTRRPSPPLSVPTPPSAWRGPGSHAQRPPPQPPIVRKPCGLCNRVRSWVGLRPLP